MTRQFLIDLGRKYPNKWILVKDDVASYKVFSKKQDAINNSDNYLYLVYGEKIVELAHEKMPVLEEILEISKLDSTVFFLFSSIKNEFSKTEFTYPFGRQQAKRFFLSSEYTHLILDGLVVEKKQ